jgi:oligopeptide transport system substrate-binding protein
MNNMIQAEQILVQDDAGIAPVYFEGVAYLVRPSIKNLVVHPTGTQEFKHVRVS